MTYDLIGSIVQLKREEDVIASILELFSVLFSPESVSYASYDQGTVTGIVSRPPERSACDFFDSSPQALISQGDLVCENGFLFQISYDNELLGLVAIQNIAFPKYREKYRDTSQFVLRVCGLAVSNARLYHTLNTTLEERNGEILLRKQAERGLQEANKKLNLLSSITRHDILNQIMVADFYLDMAIEEASDPFVENLETVHTAVAKIQRQIEFTRDYQDLGFDAPAWQDPVPLIDACFREQQELKRGDGVKVTVDLFPVELYADTMLGKVFCNLISNAFNHAKGMTRLSVSGKPEGDQYVILVEDDGSGVPEDKKDLIFKAGFGRNHGYGLFLVQQILGITDIAITEKGTPDEGARFELVVLQGGWRVPEEK
jgi:signal transduction histidine kinase